MQPAASRGARSSHPQSGIFTTARRISKSFARSGAAAAPCRNRHGRQRALGACGAGSPAREGHRRGKDSVRAVVEAARELGIPYLTLFVFSSENWGRPDRRSRFLMQLFHRYLVTETKRLMKRDIRVMALGDTAGCRRRCAARSQQTVEMTAGNRRMTSRSRSPTAAGRISLAPRAASRRRSRTGTLAARADRRATVARELATGGMPDPDLLIRTSGELRISNFFLFQLAYTELYFTDTLWPDFRERDLLERARRLPGARAPLRHGRDRLRPTGCVLRTRLWTAAVALPAAARDRALRADRRIHRVHRDARRVGSL